MALLVAVVTIRVKAATCTATGPLLLAASNSSPTPNDANRTGMVTPGPPSVPLRTSVRPGWLLVRKRVRATVYTGGERR
jgi:hypothetical protein